MSTEPRLLLRAASASARVPDRLEGGARALLNGLWLGLLSDGALEALDRQYYDATDLYRTDDWNARGLAPWEAAAVEAHFGAGSRVHVAGCGGGRELLALLQRGHPADGSDPNAGLVEFARGFLARNGHAAPVEVAPRDGLAAGGPLDGILVGWGSYSLMHGRGARAGFLAQARARLVPGAPLLMSYFSRTEHGRELRATRELANAIRRARGATAIDLGDTLAPNRVHVFTPAEIAAEAAAAGFDVTSQARVAQATHVIDYALAVLRSR